MGNESRLVPMYANADRPRMASAPAHAAAISSPAVTRSVPISIATSSGRPAAAMSRRRRRFTAIRSVGRRQRLGALHRERYAIDRHRSLTRTGAHKLETEFLVRVALAEEH